MNDKINFGCNPQSIESWIDLNKSCPKDPLDIIAYADIGGTSGEHAFSSDYIEGGGSWTVCAAAISSTPTVKALETDNKQKEADAKQWNFSHKTWGGSGALTIPLRNKIFLRGGAEWSNGISFSSGGAAIQEIELSLLDNAATRGDKQGTTPVIRWSSLSETDLTINITFKVFGEFTLGLLLSNGADVQMFELDIIVVP